VIIEKREQGAQAPVSVIVPAFNEEGAVASEVAAIFHVLNSHGIPHEVLVVDDGSEDKTAQEALKAGARVFKHSENRGYGSALKTGIAAAENERIVIIDADGTYPPEQIPALLKKLETADMVVGARNGSHVHIPLVRRPAKWLLRRLAQRIAGKPIADLNSGLRAFWRDSVTQYFSVLSDRFSFTTTSTLALLADGYRIVYHTIDYHPRVGKSKIRARHFMEFMVLILRMAMLFQPLRIFLPLSILTGSMGILKVIFDIGAFFPRHSGGLDPSLVYDAVLSTSALLLLTAALQLLLIGMVADGLLRRIAQHNRFQVSSRALSVVETDGSQPREQQLVLHTRD